MNQLKLALFYKKQIKKISFNNLAETYFEVMSKVINKSQSITYSAMNN